MWRRFTSTLADVQQQPIIFPEIISTPRMATSIFTFRKQEVELFNWLMAVAPCFPVKAKNVSIINEPKDFYDTLLKKCEKAQKRITLASLYLGTGSQEKQLISVINDNLKISSGNLKINVLLDFQRGTRGEISSKTMLLPLLKDHRENCRISMYHTPYLRGLSKKLIPQRWNEIIELQHMKIYLIDNTVIISGANLSKDYFTNRQDRYVVIEDKDLADFYANLVGEVQECCLQLQNNGSVEVATDSPSPFNDDKNKFISYARGRIEQFYHNSIVNQQNKGQGNIDSSDTWVMPLIQAGGLGIKSDSEATSRLLSSAPSSGKIRLATGYFNLTREYAEALVNDCNADCSLLMAHPNANGFKGARGPAGGVPDAYSLLAKKFYDYVESCGQQNRITLMEYEKPGWTYHGKGLWYYPPGETMPSLTLIGSPNFGERSVNRDLETQIALVTTNKDLRKQLHQECETLHKDSKEPGEELRQRSIPTWVHMTVGLFRNYF